MSKVAGGCSFANAGQLSACNAMSWHQYGYLWKGLKSLFDGDSAVRLGSIFDTDKLRWLRKFLKLTLTGQQRSITHQLMELSLDNRLLMQQLMEQLKFDINYRQQGIVKVFRRHCELQQTYSMLSPWQQSLGLRVLNTQELAELEPNAHWQDYIGAVYAEKDSHADMHAFCQQLMAHLLDQGHQFIGGVEVLSLHCQADKKSTIKVSKQVSKQLSWLLNTRRLNGQDDRVDAANEHEVEALQQPFDAVVVAAGAETPTLLKPWIKDWQNAQIYPVTGYSITLDMRDQDQSQRASVAILDETHKIASSCLGDYYRIAGFAEWRSFSTKVNTKRTQTLLAWYQRVFPQGQFQAYSEWACMRPVCANMLPIQKQIQAGLFVSSGGAHLGWTTALVCGQRLANLLN